MMDTLIDRILECNNPTVVGLDPTIEMLPEGMLKRYISEYGKTPMAVSYAFLEFCVGIIDSIYDIVPAVKLQIAMFERYGVNGLNVYNKICSYAKLHGMIVIGDIKRGDIASTAEAYASHVSEVDICGEKIDVWSEDFVTLSPYMGSDSITPFIDAIEKSKKGLFVLLKTSNPSSSEIQDLTLESGKKLYEHVGELIEKWGVSAVGKYGFSNVGAVVGATNSEQGKEIRKLMPNTFFLVPGYGVQGANAGDLDGFFDEQGMGCIVNSSRGIITNWMNDNKYLDGTEALVGAAARDAALKMRNDLTGMR